MATFKAIVTEDVQKTLFLNYQMAALFKFHGLNKLKDRAVFPPFFYITEGVFMCK